MKCRVNNPKCDGNGLIKTENAFEYAVCDCAYIRKAEQLYVLGGGLREFMKFPSQLKQDLKIGDFQNKTTVSSQQFFKQLDPTLTEMIKNRQHLVLTGKMGTGKTQIGSTLLLSCAIRGFKPLFIDLRDVQGIIKNDKKMDELKGKIERADVVLLDDLGVEAIQDYFEQHTNNFVDWLIRRHKGLLIVTTNKNTTSQTELQETYPNGARLISALLKSGTQQYYFGGENIRQTGGSK